jgi:hypothetical protein
VVDGAIAILLATVIFAVRNVQHPILNVLDTPVTSFGAGQPFGARRVIADVATHLADCLPFTWGRVSPFALDYTVTMCGLTKVASFRCDRRSVLPLMAIRLPPMVSPSVSVHVSRKTSNYVRSKRLNTRRSVSDAMASGSSRTEYQADALTTWRPMLLASFGISGILSGSRPKSAVLSRERDGQSRSREYLNESLARANAFAANLGAVNSGLPILVILEKLPPRRVVPDADPMPGETVLV